MAFFIDRSFSFIVMHVHCGKMMKLDRILLDRLLEYMHGRCLTSILPINRLDQRKLRTFFCTWQLLFRPLLIFICKSPNFQFFSSQLLAFQFILILTIQSSLACARVVVTRAMR